MSAKDKLKRRRAHALGLDHRKVVVLDVEGPPPVSIEDFLETDQPDDVRTIGYEVEEPPESPFVRLVRMCHALEGHHRRAVSTVVQAAQAHREGPEAFTEHILQVPPQEVRFLNLTACMYCRGRGHRQDNPYAGLWGGNCWACGGWGLVRRLGALLPGPFAGYPIR